MNKTYSLCVVFNRNEARGMLRDLSPFLAPDSRARFENLDWEPVAQERRRLRIGAEGLDAYGIAGVETEGLETENSFEVFLEISLAVEFDTDILKKTHSWEEVNGKVRMGPFWLSVQAGEKYALLKLVAASEELGLTLEESRSVANMGRYYAEAAKAMMAFLPNFEEGYSYDTILFPLEFFTYFPDAGTLEFENRPGFSVDHYVNYALAHWKGK